MKFANKIQKTNKKIPFYAKTLAAKLYEYKGINYYPYFINQRFSFIFLFLFIISLLLSGCIQKSSMQQYIPSENLKFVENQFITSNTCQVMVCQFKEKTLMEKIKDWLGNLIDLKESKIPSLAGGNCSFKKFDLTKQKDQEELTNLINRGLNESDSLNFTQLFMIGTESSILVGEEFKSYCNGNLGFMIIDVDPSKMLRDTEIGRDDYKTNALRANCILNYTTIPFYRIYNLQSGFISLFSESLNGVGPVFISPGYGFSTNPSKFRRFYDVNPSNPSGSFQSIKNWCDNCITVAVINFNDTSTLEFYKQSGDLNYIDIIGFTVDINNFTTCDAKRIIIGKDDSIKSFAQNITSLYHKPVMVLGISLKEIQPDSDRVCEWTNDSIADFYQQLFKSIPFLAKSGVIGISIISNPNSMPSLAFNTSAFFCSIYYNKEVSKPYYIPAIFSIEGDVLSGCNRYTDNSNLLSISDLDIDSLRKIKISKIEYDSCNNIVYVPPLPATEPGQPIQPGQPSQPGQDTQPIQPPSLPPIDSPNYNLAFEIQELASRNNIDYYLLLAALNYFNQIKEPVSSFKLIDSHCLCSDLSGAQYNRCCIAETLSYYYYKPSVARAAGSDTDLRRYLALYGLITGDTGLNAEIYRITNTEISDMYLRNPFVDKILKSGSTVKIE